LLAAGALTAVLAVDPAVKEVSRTLNLVPDGRVSIDTYKGTVKVTGWDAPKVEIRARVEPEAGFWGTDQEGAEKTEIRIDASSNSVRIKSDYRHVPRRWFGTTVLPLVHYEIRMPRTAHLAIKDHKSRTEVAGLKGEATIESYKGTVEVTGLEGGLDLETYKGEARVRFTQLRSASRFETYKGDIDVAIPGENGFRLESDLGRRANLSCDFAMKLPARDSGRRGQRFSSDVNGGGPRIYLKSCKGDLRLRRG
jgi:hypothetical protein